MGLSTFVVPMTLIKMNNMYQDFLEFYHSKEIWLGGRNGTVRIKMGRHSPSGSQSPM